jgi:type IV pilus assembly protein PilE
MGKLMKLRDKQAQCGRKRGFTLIELMIVVAIIAIISAIAYPAYGTYVVKTKRGAAKACIGQYVAFMERYYTANLTYVGADPALDCAIEGKMALDYTFSIGTPTATTYTVTAQRTTAFALSDTTCGNLTLTQAGARGVSAGTVAKCW